MRLASSSSAELVICLFALLGSPGAVPAQSTRSAGSQRTPSQQSQSLTVADIRRLVQAGLPEDLIIAKIRQNGKAFDLTTDELLDLKKAGASANVLKTMIDPTTPPSSSSARGAASAPAAQSGVPIPDEVGVYWAEAGTQLRRIEGIAVSNMRTGSTLASRMTLGLKRARINAQLNGSRAELRITERQPQFVFYLPEDASVGDYVLLRLAEREDVRQIELGERTMWKEQTGVDHAKQVDFTYTRLKSRIYLLTPKGELQAGEYGFYVASGVELKKATGRIYDFGIQ